MTRFSWVGSTLLLLALLGAGGGVAAWKVKSIQKSNAAAANRPEPMEIVTAEAARATEYRPTTTAIGTVLALRSITLRNELAGTVRRVALTPGEIVEAGAVLVALDVSVEAADLAANTAQAALAETEFARVQRLINGDAAADIELERVRAERDVALAQVARIKAVIERKTIRAPFRAKVGMADVHIGQYLLEGTQLTTLQGVDEAVHIDFAVPQRIAAGLRDGGTVEVLTGGDEAPAVAKIVAVDARVDPTTRNGWVRALLESAPNLPAPGASVRVRVPAGAPRSVVAVPVSALRKGPAGDHVFVIAADKDGKSRAHLRAVESGAMLGDDVLIHSGLEAGEQVAAAGSFKLRESVLVMIAGSQSANAKKE